MYGLQQLNVNEKWTLTKKSETPSRSLRNVVSAYNGENKVDRNEDERRSIKFSQTEKNIPN